MTEPKKTTLGWVPTAQPTTQQPMPDWYAQQQQFYAQQAEAAVQQPQYHQPQYPQYPYPQPQPQPDAGLAGLLARGQHDPSYQPYAQQPYAQQPYAQQPYAQQPYAQQPYAQQPYAQQPYAQQQPQPDYSQYAQQQPQPPQQFEYLQYPQYGQTQYPQQLAPAPTEKPKKQRSISSADATVGTSARRRFIRLTYLHLLFAMLAFAGLSWLFQTNDFLVENVSAPFFAFAIKTRYNWGIVLLGFMAVSWVADRWASHAKSRGMQYLGLALYTLAEALIFVPLLVLVEIKTASILATGGEAPHILRDSAIVTLGVFTALTASVFLTKKDFSFLRSGLMMASGAALTLIACSIFFGFSLGLVFSVAMVLLAAGYILYQTSQVLAHYDPESHVAAALALFSSVALMFWYVIRIFMRMRE